MAMALMTVSHPAGKPTLEEAARQLGVDVAKVDSAYGVVVIDPEQGLYAVQVEASAAASPDAEGKFAGPWSNPNIASFGPIE